MKLLIVVDMQNDFIDGSLGTKEACGIVDYVASLMNDFEGDIICTKDTHPTNYLETQEGKFLPVEHCIKGTKGYELNEKINDIAISKNAKIIEKPTFGSTELIDYINNKYSDIEEIIIVGLCTDICVISNALLLKANFYETPITLDTKGIAGVTEELNEKAIDVMKSCQINIK